MTIESDRDLAGLRRAGRVVALALREMKEALHPGITTRELDEIGARVFGRHGARSAPQLFYGAPCANFISVNDEAVHGLPGDRVIEAGDLVKIDVTAELDGYVADAAVTVAMPDCTEEGRRLRECVEFAFERAISVARAGRPVNKIGRVVETAARKRGFTVLPPLGGHGVGRAIHEEPTVPNYYERRLRGTLDKGLVITIEPILSAGLALISDGDDGWTIKTADSSLSAHHEHTIVITRGRPILLTVA